MKAKNGTLMTLDEFKEKNYGKRGTKNRDKLEAGCENFKIGVLAEEARLQEKLAQAVNTIDKAC